MKVKSFKIDSIKKFKRPKRAFKDRVGRLFNYGKNRDAWRGVKTLAGVRFNSSPTEVRVRIWLKI